MTIIETIMTPANKTHRVAFLLLDGVIAADFAGPSELLNRVVLPSGQKAYETRLCNENRFTSMEHYKLETPFDLGAIQWADTVIVPGTQHLFEPLSENIKTSLLAAYKSGKRVISICSGAFILAATGILDGKKATTHWLLSDLLQSHYPNITVNPNVLFIEQGNVFTSAGATAGLDLMLYMVRLDFGAEISASAARMAVVPLERPGGQAQFIDHDLPQSAHGLQPLMSWIESNYKDDLTLEDLAKKSSTSPRTLHRHFMKLLGMSPAAYVTQTRIKKSRILLESSVLSIEQISAKTGFGTSANFRQRFKKQMGVSPTEYRKSFQAKD